MQPTQKQVSAKESGHWYDRNGQPVFEVQGAKKMVKPTIVHARKLGLVPGITTILKVANKPQLTTWLRKQSILAALTLPRQEGETEDAWLDRVTEDADSIGGAAAEEGTRIHAAIERSYLGIDYDPAYSQHVEGVRALIQRVCGDQVWSPEKSFYCTLGFGSKSDLHSDGWVLDFKGKDGDQATLDDLDVYEDHEMQLAATRHGLWDHYSRVGGIDFRSSADCAIVYVSRTHPGACSLKRIPQEKLDRGWQMFLNLLGFWRLRNGCV